VIRTRVGYAGGESTDPTYQDLDGHTETIQLDFDPARVTYAQLLEIFWDSHHPTSEPFSTQYMSILFLHDDEQRRLAEQSKAAEEARLGKKLYTDLRPYRAFHRAEDYHQKHSLRWHEDLLAELTAIYPDADDLTDSTVAARVNGIVDGEGQAAELEAELDSYGLSSESREKLRRLLVGSSADGS